MLVLQQNGTPQERLWKRKESENQNKKANQVDSGMIDEVLTVEALLVCNVSQDAENWLLDSSASHHMSPHRSWFTSYEVVNGSFVFMENNGSCQTVGMGNVKIKMYDDTFKTLSDVRHVPELKKNLISLGVLDSNGYKFTSQNGVLKVSKGALAVMMVEKVGNVYGLKGSTQFNEVAIVSKKAEEGS